MDSQKLLYEQQMVAEAAAAGFCRPPREKRSEYYGRSAQAKRDCFRGLDYKKFMDEQQALEQAEAAGFCVPREVSKMACSTPQWDLRSRTPSMDERRITAKDIWRGSGDAPTTEFSNATSRISITESRSRSNGDEDDDEEGSSVRNLSDESLLQHNPTQPKIAQYEPLPLPNAHDAVRSSSEDTCHTEVLAPCSARMAEKQPSFPDMPQDMIRDDGMQIIKVSAIAFIFGLILFIIAEIIFQKYGRSCQSPKRAKHSLLRMLVDDIIYFAVRRFSGPNSLSEE